MLELAAALDLVIELARCGDSSQPLQKVGEEARVLIENEQCSLAQELAEMEEGDPPVSSPSRFVLLKYQQLLEFVRSDVMNFASDEAQEAACASWEFTARLTGFAENQVLELSKSIAKWKCELVELASSQPVKGHKKRSGRGRRHDKIDRDLVRAFEQAGRPLGRPEFRQVAKGVWPDIRESRCELLLRKLQDRHENDKDLHTGEAL